MLEETGQALRLQRDEAREEVARNKVEVANLDEQLAQTRAQASQKSATIDRMLREHAALEVEMAAARVITTKEERRRGAADGGDRPYARLPQEHAEARGDHRPAAIENEQLQSARLSAASTRKRSMR